jgi:murein DD-endopeptidase MepM/ murein hydrolase activator NlpD
VNGEHREYAFQSAYCSSRASATALGLALSVAASGFVFQQNDNPAVAAESPIPASSIANSQSAEGLDQESMGGFRVMQSVSVTQTPRSAAADALRQPSKHIVREGDTLWSISRRYGVSPNNLASANNLLEDSTLQIGQALLIPAGAQPVSESSAHARQVTVSSQSSQAERNLAHLQIQRLAIAAISDEENNSNVNPGDRPSVDVSRRNVSQATTSQAVADLQASREQLRSTLSSIRSESSPISSFPVSSKSSRVTEKLARVMSSESSRFDAWPAPSSPRDEATVSSPSTVESRLISYRLQPGDTLAAIANRHNVSLQAIIEVNPISNPNRVFAGQTIRIPVAEPQLESTSSSEDPQGESTALRGLNEEALISALPQGRFSTTGNLLFSSAPVVPLPMLSAEPDADVLPGVEDVTATEVEASSPETNNSVAGDSTTGSSIAASDNPASSEDRALADAEEGNLEEGNLYVDGVETESEDSPATSSDIYVENLIDDIEELASPVPSEAEQAILDQLNQVTSQDVAFRSSYRPDQSYIERQDAINPEFQSEPVQVDNPDTSNNSVPDPNSSEPLMAAAPLGSENFRPLNQPVTGRMVSPELPPLPGFENYIPNGEATFNGYLWPARGVLTSGYGWRWGRMHRGIDVAAPVGTPIYAAAPGVIEFSGWNSGGYGNMVDIRHPDGSKTRYAHNSRNLVRVGQRVAQGQQIAEMGSTGYSTGPHVHFEIHKPDSGTVNPIAFLPSR